MTIIPIFLIANHISAQESNLYLENILKKAVFDTLVEKDAQILYKNPKDAINILLGFITSTKEVITGCLNPTSSNLYPGHVTYEAVTAARIIEWLLLDNNAYPNTCGKNSKGFILGILIKNGNKYSKLSKKDVAKLKGVYINWWQKSKKKTISSLRKINNPYNTILQNSQYKWM